MVADFNSANKQIYGIQMLSNAQRHNLMLEEIYSKQNKMADDGTLTKVLTYNIGWQPRRPAGIALVDAINWYDRIEHAIASMVFQAFGVPSTAVEALLNTIQEMKFFVCTGFGHSTDFASSKFENKTQGLCQGNGAYAAGWTVISICIINAHKKRGHGAHFICPITQLRSHIVGVIYNDDTDLIHFRTNVYEGRKDTFMSFKEQSSTVANFFWQSEGALKLAKCFFHLIPFKFRADDTWYNKVPQAL
jgi:hypothetical protein